MGSHSQLVSRTTDLAHLRRTIELAAQAVQTGNHPFGSVLVDSSGTVIAEGHNRFATDGGPGHAETNLARHAARTFPADMLASCVLYTSVEPCCMCAGTIYWANIGAVVYGMSERRLRDITQGHPQNLTQDLPCAVVFAAGQRKIDVRGPFDEVSEEIAAAHQAFWMAP